MVKTLEYDATQTPINFADSSRSRSHGSWGWDDDTYCIWSCRFSADNNEVSRSSHILSTNSKLLFQVIAGGRSKIFGKLVKRHSIRLDVNLVIVVYDLIANRRTVKIPAHDDDVNSCCWADQGSNVLISASDDSYIKIWYEHLDYIGTTRVTYNNNRDRRSLGSSNHPSGVLIGHTQGITNVSAKGDGRYVISNGKDQALRLWDLRKMRSQSDYIEAKSKYYGLAGFDYRYVLYHL